VSHHMSRFIIGSLLLATSLCIVAPATPDKKPTAAEIVTKHLESIGSAEARSRVHGIRVKGLCTLTVRSGGLGAAQGEVLMASEGDKNLLKMVFQSEENPTWFKFDGDKASVSQFRPGRRTSLENFFAAYEGIIKEGLVGGTLSEAWPLLKLDAKNPKLESSGTKEVDGKNLLVLKYTPHKGSDMKILLFFESDTFRHVRTEYSQTIYPTDQQRIPGGRGLPSVTEARSSPARINVSETFSNFKDEQGLSLPHTYKFELSIQSDIRPALIDWVFELSDFKFNVPFDTSEVSLLRF